MMPRVGLGRGVERESTRKRLEARAHARGAEASAADFHFAMQRQPTASAPPEEWQRELQTPVQDRMLVHLDEDSPSAVGDGSFDAHHVDGTASAVVARDRGRHSRRRIGSLSRDLSQHAGDSGIATRHALSQEVLGDQAEAKLVSVLPVVRGRLLQTPLVIADCTYKLFQKQLEQQSQHRPLQARRPRQDLERT